MNKFLSFFLCLVLLFGAVSCSPTSVPPSAPPSTPPSDPPSEKTYEEQKALYSDVISQYTSLLKAKQDDHELSTPSTEGTDERSTAISNALYGIVTSAASAEAVKDYGYGYKDLDGNGTLELMLLHRNIIPLAIFTLSDDLPILLASRDGANGYSYISFALEQRFPEKQRFFMRKVGDTDATFYISYVEGDKMAYEAIYGEVYNQEKTEVIERFQMVDGKKVFIDKEAFDELYREQEQAENTANYNRTCKLVAPFIHLPLAESIPGDGLPLADFSDYTAVRETYKTISTCLDTFVFSDWTSGKYDRLFAFSNDISFEYYNRLLRGAYRGGYIGYDEIDLNGDGEDELVLLNEDHRVKAIFTKKDGAPLLLDSFVDETCWFDDAGLIHVDREDYYENEYSLYELTKDGDYRLKYSILLAKNGNRYLTKDGKTEQISFEESLEIYYDDYCRYSEPFEPNEETRNASRITFTPLFTESEDLVSAAITKTWHKYANLEKTTGKDLARGNTYITFKNATDTQIELDIKYVFSFSYPDPNREGYFLYDTTESFLTLTARKENGAFVIADDTIMGKLEFFKEHLWLIIEESSDDRFPVGFHCYEEHSGY